jgi:hypothetical protein
VHIERALILAHLGITRSQITDDYRIRFADLFLTLENCSYISSALWFSPSSP